MELIYPNKTKVLARKKMLFKVNKKEYLLYAIGTPVNDLETICFGEYKNDSIYDVEPTEMQMFTKFLTDFANGRVNGNPLYVQIAEPSNTVTVFGGAKTQLPQTSVGSIVPIDGLTNGQEVAPKSSLPLQAASAIQAEANQPNSTQPSPASQAEANPTNPTQPSPASQVELNQINPAGSLNPTQSAPLQPAKPKKKKKTWLIVLLVIILILVLGLGYFAYKVFSSPKNLLVWSAGKTIANVSSVLNNDDFSNIKEFTDDNDKIDLNNTTSLKYNSTDGSQTIKLVTDYAENKTDKVSGINMALSGNDQKILEFNGILADEKLYFAIPNVLKNSYFTNFNYFSIYGVKSTDDSSTVASAFVTSAYSTIKDEDFIVNKNSNITVDGKEVSTTMYSYELNKDRVLAIVKAFCTKVLDDSETKQAFMSVYSISEDKVGATLDSLVSSINSADYKTVTINFYIKGLKDVALVELTQDNQTYKIYSQSNSVELVIAGNKNYDIVLTKDEKTKDYTIDYSYDKTATIKGTIKADGTYSIKCDTGNGATVDADGSVKISEVTKDSNYSMSLTANITFAQTTDGKTNSVNYVLTSDTTIKTGTTIDTTATNLALDIKDITEEDIRTINSFASILNSYAATETAMR